MKLGGWETGLTSTRVESCSAGLARRNRAHYLSRSRKQTHNHTHAHPRMPSGGQDGTQTCIPNAEKKPDTTICRPQVYVSHTPWVPLLEACHLPLNAGRVLLGFLAPREQAGQRGCLTGLLHRLHSVSGVKTDKWNHNNNNNLPVA